MTIHDLVHRKQSQQTPLRQQNYLSRSLISLQDDMNRLFHDFFGDSAAPLWSERFENFPALDVVETEKAIKIKADLSGVNPDDVDVSVTEGFLTIKGAREAEKEESDENYLRRELSYGSFLRTIALPEIAQSENAEASFKNGVLTVIVPKKEGALKKAKKVKIKKAA